jgi:dephospho-CoA kinase
LTDVAARILIDNDEDVKENLNSITGIDLYKTGTLNREVLANIIFVNKALLEKVNHIVHPLVFRSFKVWAGLQKAQYVIMESAILFESGAKEIVDKTVSVIAPVEERIQRVSRRNRFSIKQIQDRIASQITDEERIKMSDYVIYNSEKDMIIPAVIEIHNIILRSI